MSATLQISSLPYLMTITNVSIYWFIFPDLNKSKRRLSETIVKPGYLEGGASGRLPRMDLEVAAQSNRW